MTAVLKRVISSFPTKILYSYSFHLPQTAIIGIFPSWLELLCSLTISPLCVLPGCFFRLFPFLSRMGCVATAILDSVPVTLISWLSAFSFIPLLLIMSMLSLSLSLSFCLDVSRPVFASSILSLTLTLSSVFSLALISSSIFSDVSLFVFFNALLEHKERSIAEKFSAIELSLCSCRAFKWCWSFRSVLNSSLLSLWSNDRDWSWLGSTTPWPYFLISLLLLLEWIGQAVSIAAQQRKHAFLFSDFVRHVQCLFGPWSSNWK